MHRIASELKAKVPGISQKLLEQQLRQSCKGARQCGKCHFGPVEHFKCNNLTTHHEQKGINNSCPRSGWFAEHIREWPKWNGKVSSAAIVTRTINLDFAELSADHPSAGSEEGLQDKLHSIDREHASEAVATAPGGTASNFKLLSESVAGSVAVDDNESEDWVDWVQVGALTKFSALRSLHFGAPRDVRGQIVRTVPPHAVRPSPCLCLPLFPKLAVSMARE